MQALLFEVLPKTEARSQYFEIAASLRPILDQSPGLVFLDRYESLDRRGLVLSHSLWRDEASLARWRSNKDHYAAQCAGRKRIFEDYRLRIGAIVDEWTPDAGVTARSEDGAYHDPDFTPRRYFAVLASQGAPASVNGFEEFRSVYRENEFLAVGTVGSRSECHELVGWAARAAGMTSARAALVCRDYGMHDRAEAPQYLAGPVS